MSYKTTIYWAERAMVPALHFTPLVINGRFGLVHGHVVCFGNFAAVDAKRLADYEWQSARHPRQLPIWC